ncbi:family 43 glycosylhydrolase [Halorhabdus amylolytica]|uniref:family 43 glycosylhydrolase n=1 Tax=Halorhabdus amylolytica TaxID=2559573 RepID=UPI00145B8F1F|nr:family 43 glycosylhydrolase [Halorhabdus amylolytica]
MLNTGTDTRISRRTLLKAAGIGAVGTAAAGAVGSTMIDSGPDYYRNPVYEPHFPDPTVLHVDGTYYAYGTNMKRSDIADERLTPILSSTDLVDWTYVGEGFDSRPGWVYGSIWAPDIAYYDGQYYLYYSLAPRDGHTYGIGVATADDPSGPFTDRGAVITDETEGRPGHIDPYFHCEDGTPYLLYGSFYGIWGIELTSDGLEPVSGTKFQLAGDAYEGTILHERNGYYYLFLSTGNCCAGLDSTYELEVGRARSLTGPYHDQSGTDLRDIDREHSGVAVLSGSQRFPGPGHGDVTTFDDGSDWLLYHAYDAREGGYVDGTFRRVLMVDRIRWRDGWPVVACDGRPSVRSTVPGSESHTCDATGKQERT